MAQTKYRVWEPANESHEDATVIEADTPGQAAFLTILERKMEHRSIMLSVSDGEAVVDVTMEPRTWMAVVSVSEPRDGPRFAGLDTA